MRLTLLAGAIQVQIKRLNLAAGSKFTVTSPNGPLLQNGVALTGPSYVMLRDIDLVVGKPTGGSSPPVVAGVRG